MEGRGQAARLCLEQLPHDGLVSATTRLVQCSFALHVDSVHPGASLEQQAHRLITAVEAGLHQRCAAPLVPAVQQLRCLLEEQLDRVFVACPLCGMLQCGVAHHVALFQLHVSINQRPKLWNVAARRSVQERASFALHPTWVENPLLLPPWFARPLPNLILHAPTEEPHHDTSIP